MTPTLLNILALSAIATAVLLLGVGNPQVFSGPALLNVSYAPTAPLFTAIDSAFLAHQHARGHAEALPVRCAHGGSSRQSRAVIDGLEADMVTLALPSDVQALSAHGLIPADWANRLPHHSQPYTSTIVFTVRRGNPKGIHDWPDLIRPGITVVTPNPTTSGNGKLSFLAAWGAVIARGGTDAQAQDYVTQLYTHAAPLDPSATEATSTFIFDLVGDVHLTWESEAWREATETEGAVEIVVPPISILAEPAVTWVDTYTARHQTTDEAKDYCAFLFTEAGQQILARFGYRPIADQVMSQHRDVFPNLTLVPITQIAQDWDHAQIRFFGEHGIFDIIRKRRSP
jgi:sulfate transport system substrate-binding protein